ncbi:MAG: DNA-directed RNA polymerase subunit N [Candidatus Thermoplasmatota archaeon]|jgi:DNA-directed RNA polymerase subunit N (RpoN/RPB10)|nr:DNA-directed RNA polymerase subunit N [Euryarchaeota archaeon]MEC7722723.1 DNA-directed RNA polymerase subunit N [Candidatus Thermoplasmatota archaeon]RJV00993.1 MAG: DNA-directed RNA polymerase subunit N [Candidatus Poseidoniales archaeon]RPG75038.1 MAG: DNA-directed RNA polymerase subunit N [Euryarchaeota archaeon TMED141]HII18414.1 DNA-directed RNA polymerase subunit N [Candidatus Poseidoniaceae archaeon]|tara:strand:+ start:3197 stop:3403 length:207 start_codon:yes stop_codon:yes gene_type:complete
MIIPVRCFSCGSIVAHVWEEYNAKVDGGMEPAQALDEVGLERYCCRRMYIGHIDLLEDVATYSAARHR